MVDEQLRGELVALRAEDLRVREELVAADELGGAYVPRMEEVHKRNAARLRELIAGARLARGRPRWEGRSRSSLAHRAARARGR